MEYLDWLKEIRNGKRQIERDIEKYRSFLSIVGQYPRLEVNNQVGLWLQKERQQETIFLVDEKKEIKAFPVSHFKKKEKSWTAEMSKELLDHLLKKRGLAKQETGEAAVEVLLHVILREKNGGFIAIGKEAQDFVDASIKIAFCSRLQIAYSEETLQKAFSFSGKGSFYKQINQNNKRIILEAAAMAKERKLLQETDKTVRAGKEDIPAKLEDVFPVGSIVWYKEKRFQVQYAEQTETICALALGNETEKEAIIEYKIEDILEKVKKDAEKEKIVSPEKEKTEDSNGQKQESRIEEAEPIAIDRNTEEEQAKGLEETSDKEAERKEPAALASGDALKENAPELLYHSFDIISKDSELLESKFIVAVDSQNKTFISYNGKDSKIIEQTIDFSYLENIGKIDRAGNTIRVTTNDKESIEKKLAEYNDWKERENKRAAGYYSPLTDKMIFAMYEYQETVLAQKEKNFTIKEETLPEKRTPSERLNQNIEAISMLKRIESGERRLTAAAQEVLARYVGWGGLAEVFDERKGGQWQAGRNFLKENLTEEEYQAARSSTLTSFYTPKVVADSMYQTLSDMGFRRGNILEPSMGIGNFIGCLPESMKKSAVYGVELDSISGRIAALLYPESNIEVKGLEETSFSNNFFDIAIGNVPFGEYQVSDPVYHRHHFLIHDYFFAKAIDKVRTGGVIAFITSCGTLDKKDESVRRYLAARTELLGAIRLPNNTFKGVAGTEVTSDIIFLKKKDSIREREADWIHLGQDEKGLTYNQYFVQHPEMILGSMEEVSGRFGNTLACLPKENADLKELLRQAGQKIAASAKYESVKLLKGEIETIPATDDIKNFSFTIQGDDVYYRENSALIKRQVSRKAKDRIKDYVTLRKAVREVLRTQMEEKPEETIIEAREALKKAYDSFCKKHKFVNYKDNVRTLREDSDFPLVSSIEVVEDDELKKLADIFYKRTIAKAKIIEKVETPEEALLASVAGKGKIDFAYMENLSGIPESALIRQLKGQIFRSITEYQPGGFDSENFPYVPADEYLSGNIREKIKIIDHYLADYEKMRLPLSEKEKPEQEADKDLLTFQREKLQEVMPREIAAEEIEVKLGAAWIPAEDVRDFIIETLKPPIWTAKRIQVKYSRFSGTWDLTGFDEDIRNDLARLTYGTARVNAYELIKSALNLKEPEIKDYQMMQDGSVAHQLNEKETLLAIQKQELLKEEFRRWIFAASARRERLTALYNERFNSIRNRQYSGEALSFPGICSDIALREHQKNSVARILFGGNTLLAHAVGAGKTFSMAASVMESKRLGFCQKALIAVPKHLTGQVAREFLQLYPSANLLVAEEKDFDKDKRKRFTSRIAFGEYDAVILGHTQLEKIPMSKEYEERHYKEQIEEIIHYIEANKWDRNEAFTIKDMEKMRKNLEKKVKAASSKEQDDVLTFEELGVDRLYIDEAHYYKNLYLVTKMKNVAGIGGTEANKTSDLFMKCRYMDELTGSRGIIFATGTPISNSMSELYTMQRYLQYNKLKEDDMQNFDVWASTFGETVSSFELAPEGTRYRRKTRFSKFYNLPELMTMFKEVADVQTADMLSLPVPKAHFETLVIKPSKEQKEILKTLSDRADAVRVRRVEPREDNMLRITSDGKKMALDQRLMDPMLPDHEGSKVNVCIENVFSIWEKTKAERLTQVIFCDMSTPKKGGGFNLYDDIREKLVDRGVPREEIVFIHEAEKDDDKKELFSKVRKGTVRVLLGSTVKCGAGTNIQDKLIAQHDLDVPWRPSDMEQRAGRIIRQGNVNKEVFIYRYVTEGTFDAYLFQILENKQRFISQIMTSKTPIRAAEDVDEGSLSYAEIKAMATGNPLMKEKMELENEITRLKVLEANENTNRYKLEKKIETFYPGEMKRLEGLIEAVRQDMETTAPKGDKFSGLTLGEKSYIERQEAAEALLKAIKSSTEERCIGTYRNRKIETGYNVITNKHTFILKGAANHYGEWGESDEGNLIRMDNVLEKMQERLIRLKEQLEATKDQLLRARQAAEKPFEKAEELKDKLLRLAEINKILDLSQEKVSVPLRIEDFKQEVINFCNREYESEYTKEDFDSLYPDMGNIGIAYSETPDGAYEIEYRMDAERFLWAKLINGTVAAEGKFAGETEQEKIQTMTEHVKGLDFAAAIALTEEELERIGLEMDKDGCFAAIERKSIEMER